MSSPYITYNGSRLSVGGVGVTYDQYNPLGLPPYTLRVEYVSGHDPTNDQIIGGTSTLPAFSSVTQVSVSPNVWDVVPSRYSPTSWTGVFQGIDWRTGNTDLIRVIGANANGPYGRITSTSAMFNICKALVEVAPFDTSGVTNASNMFADCSNLTTVPMLDFGKVRWAEHMFANSTSLTTVPLYNFGQVQDADEMFRNCGALTAIPAFDLHSVTSAEFMFYDCVSVQSGAYAAYQQLAASPEATHNVYTFGNCGLNSVSGQAERAQIPQSWGGAGPNT